MSSEEEEEIDRELARLSQLKPGDVVDDPELRAEIQAVHERGEVWMQERPTGLEAWRL